MLEQKEEEIFHGSDNVFADIGLPHPQEALAKSTLMHRITTVIQERGLGEKEVAKLLHIPLLREKIAVFLQRMLRRVGKLFHMPVPEEASSTWEGLWKGYLDDFTVGQLLDYLSALDGETEIIVRGNRGPIHFKVATG